MTMQVDRIERLTEAIAAELEALPDDTILSALPPTMAAALKLVRKLGRVDVIGEARRSAISSVRALPDRCRAEPDQAQAIIDRLVGIVAWIDGQTDVEPELRLFRS